MTSPTQPSPSPLSRAQSYLRPIVYGGNDGIVTTFAIVAGFAGAGAEGAGQIGVLAVLVFGLANLFSDAVSMGLGEFLSGRSERGLYAAFRQRELQAMAKDPAAARAQLAGLLAQRGLAPSDADKAAALLSQSDDLSVELRLEHLRGLSSPASTSPAANGLSTFASFVALGVVPLSPFLLTPLSPSLFPISVAATFLALAVLGSLRSWISGERLGRSIAETLAVGGVCAVVAFTVGAMVALAGG